MISTLHISSLYCCFHWYLVHSYILLYFDVFSPLLNSTLLATPNLSPPTVFDLEGWNGHHLVGNWVAENIAYRFFNIRSLSSKNMQHKKMWFLKKNNFICFPNVYYSEIRKNGMLSCVPSHGKWNKIIKFGLSVNLWEEKSFLQDPQKAYIFYAIRFLCFSEKVSKQTMFRTALYIYFV